MPRSGKILHAAEPCSEPWPLSLHVRSLCSTTGEATTVRGPRTAKKKREWKIRQIGKRPLDDPSLCQSSTWQRLRITAIWPASVTQGGRQTVRPSEVCFQMQKVVSGDGQPSAQTSTWNVAEASPRNARQQSPKDEIRES